MLEMIMTKQTSSILTRGDDKIDVNVNTSKITR